MTHSCPAKGCSAEVPRSMLACRPHWFALPAPLRAAINASWRDRKKNGLSAWSANVMEARRLWASAE